MEIFQLIINGSKKMILKNVLQSLSQHLD